MNNIRNRIDFLFSIVAVVIVSQSVKHHTFSVIGAGIAEVPESTSTESGLVS